MSQLKLLAAMPFLILGLAACGEEEVAQQPTEPTTAEAPATTTDTTTAETPAPADSPSTAEAPAPAEAPSTAQAPAPSTDQTTPPPAQTAEAPNAAPPATMTMPPANATNPQEQQSAEATGAVSAQGVNDLQRYMGRSYTSGTVSLQLDQGGQFEMTENQGNQQVSGEYSVANGIVTFQNPSGDTGTASFPMRCRLVEEGEGFRLEPVEDSCSTLSGQTFRPAS